MFVLCFFFQLFELMQCCGHVDAGAYPRCEVTLLNKKSLNYHIPSMHCSRVQVLQRILELNLSFVLLVNPASRIQSMILVLATVVVLITKGISCGT